MQLKIISTEWEAKTKQFFISSLANKSSGTDPRNRGCTHSEDGSRGIIFNIVPDTGYYKQWLTELSFNERINIVLPIPFYDPQHTTREKRPHRTKRRCRYVSSSARLTTTHYDEQVIGYSTWPRSRIKAKPSRVPHNSQPGATSAYSKRGNVFVFRLLTWQKKFYKRQILSTGASYATLFTLHLPTCSLQRCEQLRTSCDRTRLAQLFTNSHDNAVSTSFESSRKTLRHHRRFAYKAQNHKKQQSCFFVQTYGEILQSVNRKFLTAQKKRQNEPQHCDDVSSDGLRHAL